MTCESDSYRNTVRVVFPYLKIRLEVVKVARKLFSLLQWVFYHSKSLEEQ